MTVKAVADTEEAEVYGRKLLSAWQTAHVKCTPGVFYKAGGQVPAVLHVRMFVDMAAGGV